MLRNLLILLLFFISAHALAHVRYSTELEPKFSPEFYIEESLKYFDTIDSFAPRDSKPEYGKRVIRWEWLPWLYLTGYKRASMKLDIVLTWYPTTVINRDCRFFNVQPFGRCRVTFHYLKPDVYIDIYEEFTFNDLGEITFIEAWTDEPHRLPKDDPSDPWFEGEDVKRLSVKVPGLGRPDGRLNRKALRQLSLIDDELMNLRKRLNLPISFWLKEGVRFSINGYE